MEEIVLILLVSLIGLVTGFFDSIIGAGGLISVPSLVFLGFPAHIAIATDRFGSIGQALIATLKFWKSKKIVWKYVPVLAVLSLIGSFIGAKILLDISPKILGGVIGVLMIVLLPFIFLKKDLGVVRLKTGWTKKIIGAIIYFAVMIFAGFYGQGTGPMVFYTLTFFFGLTMIESLGTGVVAWLLLCISSVIIFAFNNIIDYKIGLILFVSMSIGSYVGASTAVRKGDLWIKRLFVALVVIMSVKLLFFNNSL
ncbi:MAG: sulfite exporter TauE/SafE family protein [Nanoarchaeota archaeon]